jgi:hypothetical protein
MNKWNEFIKRSCYKERTFMLIDMFDGFEYLARDRRNMPIKPTIYFKSLPHLKSLYI